jgi:formylglycine-generating enzyme required for sulfatase activity/tRNA A-37 threonylcarbamoyl transferase component Bud32
MTDDNKPAQGEASEPTPLGNEAADTPAAPIPAIPQPSNKTVPIRLDADDYGFFNFKKGKKPPGTAGDEKPPEDPNQPWLGKEATLVGFTPDLSKPEGPKKPDFQWIGNEQTLVGVPAGAAKPQDKADGPWLGAEQTMVGMPSGGSPASSPQKPGEAWLGNEATLVGTPAAGAKHAGDVIESEKPVNVDKLRKTTATMDDGWHLKGRQGPLTGSSMGDYEVGGILGEGGMGTVYRARQISLKRRVALKVLPPNLANDMRLRERFEMEARTASLLNSPHVVQVFAAGSYNDNVFFVMEFVEGTDLSLIINEKKDAQQQFTAEEATNYVLQAARGLAEAGKHGIVHRDIKPPNLMVTSKGLVKIADFGISKLAGEHSLTMTGTAVGTPAYVSPEQGRGDAVDQRSDLYSLGIVYYELLTGQKPFDGSTANALIYQHNYAEPKLPRDINPEVPEAYQAVVLKLMQKDPINRYQDASELLNDLERVRAGSAPMTALLGAFGTGADEAMKRLGIKKQRLAPLIAAGLILILGGGGGFWYWLSYAEVRDNQRKEATGYRESLKNLDQPMAVRKNYYDDLDRLQKIVGEDADVKRWRSKLERVTKLEESLSRLDSAELPDATLRSVVKLDLEKYRTEVGDTDDIERWQNRIVKAEAEIEKLREAIAELDKYSELTSQLYDKFQPSVAQMHLLAGDTDTDAKRWGEKLEAYSTRVSALSAKMEKLSDPTSIKENDQLALKGDLEELAKMLGDQNAEVRNWANQLEIAKENLQRLRDNLARFNTVTVSRMLVEELKPDLKAYGDLVDTNEVKLLGFKRKVETLEKNVETLAGKLKRLDDETPITPTEQELLTGHLESYATLVGKDDAKYLAWQERLTSDSLAVQTLRSTLKRLEPDQPALPVVEREACEKALEDASKRGAVSEKDKQVYAARLHAEKESFERQRDRLVERKKAKDTKISRELKQEINAYVKLAGTQDSEAKFWADKSAEYDRLQSALLSLDKPAPIPENALKMVEAFAQLVGDEDVKVKEWRVKVAHVETLKRALAGLDRIESLPEQAAVNVSELIKEVGADDVDAKRWKIKVDRVNELVEALSGEMAKYVRQDKAAEHLRELADLVGKLDDNVRKWTIRRDLLEGPGQPSWAAAYDRDNYGLYADLVIKRGDKDIKQRFRYCPASTFTIGSKGDEKDRDKDEAQVQMTLSKSFWIADTECSNGFWNAVGGSNPSRYDDSERPVERLSWDEAVGFAKKLSDKVPGLSASLPTEAQWECACRTGIAGRFIGDGKEATDKDIDTLMWSVRNSGAEPKGVGRRFPNTIGLFDMHGNVWEWCQDRYGVYPGIGATDYIGAQEDTVVARGGSWGDKIEKCRAANRLEVSKDMRTVYLGFRLVAKVDWPAGMEPGEVDTAKAVP